MSTNFIATNSRALGSGLPAKVALFCLCFGTVTLVLLDWSYDFELTTLPVAKYARAGLLSIFLLYLLQTGIRFDKYNFIFGRVLLFYAALNIIYTFFSNDIISNLYYSIRILFWLVTAVVAYRLAILGTLTERILQLTLAATILLGAGSTIFFMTHVATEAGQNASAYLLLWSLPLLLLQKKSWIGYLLLALSVIAIVLTVKRGAMIALSLSFVGYTLTYLRLNTNIRAFLKSIGILSIIAILGSYLLLVNWSSVQARFADTSGSGRDQLYTIVWDHWINADLFNLFFGFGVNSVQQYTGYALLGIKNMLGPYAHSDWLQMTHDFGLLGITFMLWLHFKYLSMIRLSYKRRHPYTPSLVMGYIILFLVNIYSGHLVSPNAIYCGIILAVGTVAISNNINILMDK